MLDDKIFIDKIWPRLAATIGIEIVSTGLPTAELITGIVEREKPNIHI